MMRGSECQREDGLRDRGITKDDRGERPHEVIRHSFVPLPRYLAYD